MFINLLLVCILAWHIVSEILHRKERALLSDRLMARSFDEFKYYEEKFPKDVKIATKATEKMVESDIAIDEAEDKKTKKFISGLEEDWGPDAIDKTELDKVMGITNEPT